MKKSISILILSLSIVISGTTKPVHGHGGYSPPSNTRGAVTRTLTSAADFVNYETPHVHPLDISPDGSRLAVVNTADGHVELFSIDGVTGSLTHSESIRVGMGPVSARWRTSTELWVVNQLSDSISIIDMTSSTVVNTLITYELKNVSGLLKGSPNGDEPADVVFATYNSNPSAFVTCSRTDIIQVYNVTSSPSLTQEVYLQGEDPRSLATDGTNIYAAIYESGNSTTLIFGESDVGTSDVGSLGLPPNTAGINANGDTDHPYYVNATVATTDLRDDLISETLRSVNPAPSDTVGPYTVVDTLGNYIADGKTIAVKNLPATTPSTRPPTTSIIVRKDFTDGDKWKDDNGADWTRYINGDRATQSGRVLGWDMLDNDVAILSLSNLTDTYAKRQMNICMALNINPANGNVYMVGTEATNEIRFEPNINGTFVRVMLSVTSTNGTEVSLIDLNEDHLAPVQGGTAYSGHSVSQTERNKSIGDPRGVAFSTDGATVYISGMGSNNVLALKTSDLSRYTLGHTIEVGQGPTGIAHHATQDRLYVVNKFGASVSVIDTTNAGSETVLQTIDYHDPTPDFVNVGRVHFYGTHENSGLGQISCASCHIDGRMDRLAWDLGNPAAITDGANQFPSPADDFFAEILGKNAGSPDIFGQLITGPIGVNPNDAINTLTLGIDEDDFGKFHPMKGPMTTQTLQDIIGKEPHHWRGDKDGLEEFRGAFDGLQGDDEPLNDMKMQEFEDFIATINFPPNPFRPVDNTLAGGPTADGGTNPNLDMTGFFTAPPPSNSRLSEPGTPMEDAVPSGGDAWNGFKVYVDDTADNQFRCVDCHTLPIGAGSIEFANALSLPFSGFLEIPPGENGEAHQMVVNVDGTGQPHIKIPQTRNQIEKDGFFLNQIDGGTGLPMVSRAGFGVLHDGSVDGIVRFLSEPAFEDINDQPAGPVAVGNATSSDEAIADIVSFTLAIGGADFDYLMGLSGAPTGTIPPAATDLSAHSGVGHSLTISATPADSSSNENLIYAMTRRANEDNLGMIVVGKQSGERRGWTYDSGIDENAVFQSDRDGETLGITALLALAGGSGNEITFMSVPTEEGFRRGIDRDDDTVLDGDEADFNTDTANPDDHKWSNVSFTDPSDGSKLSPFKTFDESVSDAIASAGKTAVIHIETGSYTTGLTLNTPITLVAENGVVTIDTP